jgi:hypothetical protein
MPDIDSLAFFDALATAMNADPQAYEVLGDVDLDLAIEMRRPGAEAFRVLVVLRGIVCAQVVEIGADEAAHADCVLSGGVESWEAMFADVRAHGHATGRQTINSLTLLGDHITVTGDDPLGVDKFFRFNQTVQAFLDGAARVATAAVG